MFFCRKLDINLSLIQSAQQPVNETLDQLSVANVDPMVWRQSLDDVLERQLKPAALCIREFAELSERLAEQVERIATNRHKQNVAVDRTVLRECLNRLGNVLGTTTAEDGIDADERMRQLCVNNEYNFGNIVTMFEGEYLCSNLFASYGNYLKSTLSYTKLTTLTQNMPLF